MDKFRHADKSIHAFKNMNSGCWFNAFPFFFSAFHCKIAFTIASGCQSHAVSMCINVCLFSSLLTQFEFLSLFLSGPGQITQEHTHTGI